MFGLATATRSMTGCLLGAVALLTLYGLGAEVGALWEPFGFAAVEEATRGWSAARLERDWPRLEGTLLANRLFWAGVAALLILGGRFGLRRGRAVRGRRASRVSGRVRGGRWGRAPAFAGERRIGGADRPATVWAQLGMRTALEVRQVVLTPAFAVLLLLGLAHAGAALWRAPDAGTAGLARTLADAFRLTPVVTAVFFAGELYWNERERRMDGLIAAAPVGAPVLVAPKLAALAAVLLGLAAATAAAGAVVGLARGATPDLAGWALWYVAPKWLDWVLVGVLALFLQTLAPGKLAGWGLMVLFLIASLAMNRLGWTDPIYRYGLYPGWPEPPALSGAEGAAAYRLYWAVVAGGLAAWACARSPVRGGSLRGWRGAAMRRG